MIGGSAIALLALNGRIAGVSGILGGLFAPRAGDTAWRLCFVTGIVAGGVIVRTAAVDPFRGLAATPAGVLALAGLLVGFGASLGSGCTSGHGVCGVGRASPRSLVATLVFMTAGMLMVFVVRHLAGAGG